MMSSGDEGAAGVVSLSVVFHPDSGLDATRAEYLARRLRRELMDLGVASVAPVSAGAVPAGAKGSRPGAVRALVVAFSAAGGVFAPLVGPVRHLLVGQAGRPRRSAAIGGGASELDGAAAAARQAL